MQARDDFQNRYNISDWFTKVAAICFWANAAFAFLTLVILDCAKPLLLVMQVVLALAYVVLTVIDNCSLWYEAEIGRIKDNIANAFSANLTEEHTEGYYSNNEAPSIKKYAVNTYESALYSREEAKAMRTCAIIKIMVAVGVVFLLALLRAVDITWVLWAAQAVFSSVVIIDCIQLIVFSFKMDSVCKQFYTHLITEGGTATVDRDTILLSCVVEYETTKMYFKVRLSPKVFEKLKPELEAKWAELLSQIK